MDDKRKNVRVKASLVVSFKAKNARLAGGARTRDVSETGICLPSKYHFPVGTLIDLELRSDNLKEPIKMSARVVRTIHRNDSNFPFEAGLIFVDISPDKRKTLRDYIQRFIVEADQDVIWLE